ncbi:MAG: hypothetical protein IJ530_03815 [Treponema sp.]|uniref:hypothetical protein n=1 Tax=Treponema sp. TaxID=166 RepID=UPI0025D545AC|nr:hypothetical protein [Treponema sp.]MBQ8678871.1 hypothetical protein [Treponema sp.]
MKKILFLVSFSLILSSLSAQMKNNTSCTFSVTPIGKEVDDKLNEKMIFGGAYFLADSTMSDKYVTLGGKLYYRLYKTDTKEEESQKLDVKRAYAKIRPFGTNIFEAAIGKLYSYYLAGGYFSLTETYTGASRWGKSGVGVKTEFSGLTLGLALPASEDYTLFDEDWGLNAAVVYDFSSLDEELPLSVGFSLWYSAVGDFEVRAASSKSQDNDKKDNFAECFSLNFSKKNLAFFKIFSVFAAFSRNAEPYVSSSVFKPVSNYSNKDMKSSNLFSLAIRPTIGSVKITSESEIGHSVEGTMIPFYSALQLYFPVAGAIALKPMAGYYAAYDTSDSSKSFDTWELYPRILFEFEKWTVTAGWDTFYKEITDGEYRWLWTVPITAKYKVGR